MSDEIGDQIEKDLERLEMSASKTDSTRQLVISKLSTIVETMSIDPDNDKAMAIEAKRGIIDSLLRALNDVDSQKKSILQLKQKKKDAEVSEDSIKMIGRTVAEYMKSIDMKLNNTPRYANPENEDIDDRLDTLVKDTGVTLLAGEIEISSNTAKDISL